MSKQIKELEAQLKVANKTIAKLEAQIDSSAKAAEKLADKVKAGHVKTLATVAGHIRKLSATAEKLQPAIDATNGQPKYPAGAKLGAIVTALAVQVKAAHEFVVPTADATANA